LSELKTLLAFFKIAIPVTSKFVVWSDWKRAPGVWDDDFEKW